MKESRVHGNPSRLERHRKKKNNKKRSRNTTSSLKSRTFKRKPQATLADIWPDEK